MRRLATAVLLAALPLAACAGAGSGAGSGAGPGAGSTGAGSGSTAAPSVSLQRSGGIAGNRDELTVQPDGSWRRTAKTGSPTTGTLAADQRDRLRRMAADPALRSEASRTVPKADCSDAFDYSLTVGGTRLAWRDRPATAPR
jgi:hypothetical protein